MNDNIFKSMFPVTLFNSRHNALLTSLYASAFTNSFPAHLQNFNDSRNEEMIEKPDLDNAVFCRVVRTPRDGAEAVIGYGFHEEGKLIVGVRKWRLTRAACFLLDTLL